jgi:hypothetical protein
MIFKKISDSPVIELSIDVWRQVKGWVKELHADGIRPKYLSMRISTLQPDQDYAFIFGGYEDFTGTGAIMFDLDGLIECGFYFDGPGIDLNKSYRVIFSNRSFQVLVD